MIDSKSNRIINLGSTGILALGFIIVSILIIILRLDESSFWSGKTDYATTSYVGTFIGGAIGTLLPF